MGRFSRDRPSAQKTTWFSLHVRLGADDDVIVYDAIDRDGRTDIGFFRFDVNERFARRTRPRTRPSSMNLQEPFRPTVTGCSG